MPKYTSEEKIDYIFNELKSQKRSRIFKTLFKITIFWFIIFLYFNFVNWLDKQVVIDNISWIISDITKPIAQNIVNDMIWDTTNTQNLEKSISDQIKNNPDLLKQLENIQN